MKGLCFVVVLLCVSAAWGQGQGCNDKDGCENIHPGMCNAPSYEENCPKKCNACGSTKKRELEEKKEYMRELNELVSRHDVSRRALCVLDDSSCCDLLPILGSDTTCDDYMGTELAESLCPTSIDCCRSCRAAKAKAKGQGNSKRELIDLLQRILERN